MSTRAKFSGAFLAAGIFSIVLILVVDKICWALAGRGGGDNRIYWIEVLLCTYFFVSAFGVYIFKTKWMLSVLAVIAHALLVAAYILIYFRYIKDNDSHGYTWPETELRLALMMVAYYSPGIIIWLYVLFKRENLSGLQNMKPATDQQSPQRKDIAPPC